jgi:hypothetical protein
MRTNPNILLEPDLNNVEIVDTIQVNTEDFDYGDIDYSIDNYISNTEDDSVIKATIDIDFNVDGNISYNFEFNEGEDVYQASIKLISGYIMDAIIELLKKPNVKIRITELENMVEPHILLHMGRNMRMGKMYIEFGLDYYMHNILIEEGLYRDFCATIATKIQNNYKYEIVKYWPETTSPDYGGAACKQNNIVTLSTVSYWKSINGHYQFLEDRAEVDIDRNVYRINESDLEYQRKMELYVAKIHLINKNIENGNYNIPQAFAKYKELYEDEFGYSLRSLDMDDLEAFDQRYVYITIKNLLQYYDNANE